MNIGWLQEDSNSYCIIINEDAESFLHLSVHFFVPDEYHQSLPHLSPKTHTLIDLDCVHMYNSLMTLYLLTSM